MRARDWGRRRVVRCHGYPLALVRALRRQRLEQGRRFDVADIRHLPVGVLADIHGGAAHTPWAITVHLRRRPVEKVWRSAGVPPLPPRSTFRRVAQVFSLQGEGVAEWQYYNSLKQVGRGPVR